MSYESHVDRMHQTFSMKVEHLTVSYVRQKFIKPSHKNVTAATVLIVYILLNARIHFSGQMKLILYLLVVSYECAKHMLRISFVYSLILFLFLYVYISLSFGVSIDLNVTIQLHSFC